MGRHAAAVDVDDEALASEPARPGAHRADIEPAKPGKRAATAKATVAKPAAKAAPRPRKKDGT